MPLYEYECDACGHRFELIRKFSDPPVEVCPKCGGHVRKLISAGAFQLKGSGWYATDYAKKDNGGSKVTGSKDKDAPAGDKDSKDSKDSSAKADTSASGSGSSTSSESSSGTTAKPSADSKD